VIECGSCKASGVKVLLETGAYAKDSAVPSGRVQQRVIVAADCKTRHPRTSCKAFDKSQQLGQALTKTGLAKFSYRSGPESIILAII